MRRLPRPLHVNDVVYDINRHACYYRSNQPDDTGFVVERHSHGALVVFLRHADQCTFDLDDLAIWLRWCGYGVEKYGTELHIISRGRPLIPLHDH